jgi:hypothetical protein
MTSRERLLAACRRQPVDTIPISPRLGQAVLHHFGSNSSANALRLRTIYDFDPFIDVPGNEYPLANPYELYRHAPGVNVTMKVEDRGAMRVVDRTIDTPDGSLHEVIHVPNPGRSEFGLYPNPMTVEHMVKTRDDLPKLRHLLPPVSPRLATEYHGWEHVVGKEGVTRAHIYGPIDIQAGMVMSVEELMVNYLTDRPFVDELIGMFWQQIMAQTKALLEEGVRFFFIPWFWHSLSVGWSPQIFREWFLPMITQQVALIHQYGGIADYYDDGKLMGILPFLAEAGVDLVETCTPPPVGDFDLAKAKAEFGDRLAFKGYVDLINELQKGTVEDVRRQVHEACTVGGKGGGFVLGTSDSMREGTPIENINAYFHYGREYGRQR